MRDITISTPSSTGSAPPDSPEPEPRATQGTSWRAHAATTARTSSAAFGSTAAAGRGVVLQQPVRLVGAQLVLGRVDPAFAADRLQLADQRRDVARGRPRRRLLRFGWALGLRLDDHP